jgi:hypothetical protein
MSSCVTLHRVGVKNEDGHAMSTSRKQGGKILGAITRADAERLLLNWANLLDLPYPAKPDDACRRLIARNLQVFGQDALDWKWGGWGGLAGADLIELRDLLRRAWDARDQRCKNWYFFHLRLRFHSWKTKMDFWREHPRVSNAGAPSAQMPPKTLNNLSELTKEGIGDLYSWVLVNPEMKECRVGLNPIGAVLAPVPSAHDIEQNFRSWYRGVLSFSQMIDPGVELPTTEEMVGFISQKFDQARAAIPPENGPVPLETILAQIEFSKLTWLEPPPVTPFEAAVFYFQTSIADLAKHCGNSECPAPYFIAIKKWQKYCSEKCAGPAARESKRRWWQENRAKNGGLP